MKEIHWIVKKVIQKKMTVILIGLKSVKRKVKMFMTEEKRVILVRMPPKLHSIISSIFMNEEKIKIVSEEN